MKFDKAEKSGGKKPVNKKTIIWIAVGAAALLLIVLPIILGGLR